MSDDPKLSLTKETLRPLTDLPKAQVQGGTFTADGAPHGAPVPMGVPMTRPTTCSWGTNTQSMDPDELVR